MNPTGYRRRDAAAYPPLDHPAYRSTGLRHPEQPPVRLEHTLSEVTGPGPSLAEVLPEDADLTTNAGTGTEAMGERIIVTGRVLDEDGTPQPDTLIEVWQANAAGRYAHELDQHPAPLDPNFTGAGWCVTDADGCYRFVTIKPGAYPWRNHYNAWRPAHLHFSLFGLGLVQRLVTQMYFPGDPLLAYDPMYNSVPDARARERLVSTFDWERTIPDIALAYRFDIVLRGRDETPMDTSRS